MVVVPFSHGDHGYPPAVLGQILSGVRLSTPHMRSRVDSEGDVKDDHNLQIDMYPVSSNSAKGG